MITTWLLNIFVGGRVYKRNITDSRRHIVSVYLDNETNALLTSTKNRSGRSKSIEVAMRLKDHLLRFPDFYNSEYTEGVPSIKKR